MDEFGDDPKVIRLPTRLPSRDTEEARVREEVERLLAELEPDEPLTGLASPVPSVPAFQAKPDSPGPEPGHRNAMVCPQCDRSTWCATQLCRHCSYDLFAHAQRNRQAYYVAWKAERNRKLTVWAVWLGGGGVLTILASGKVSGMLGLLMTLSGIVAIFGAFVCGRVIEQSGRR